LETPPTHSPEATVEASILVKTSFIVVVHPTLV
jgi:hypothetical protein